MISNFLASTDIKVFGRTYLFPMLLLIGLALFLHSRCFCSAYHYFLEVYKQMLLLQYSSRLSLHLHVPLTCVFINFIQRISRSSRVTARKSYFECYMRVGHGVLHASQTSCAARKSLYVAILRTYHSKLKTKQANESK